MAVREDFEVSGTEKKKKGVRKKNIRQSFWAWFDASIFLVSLVFIVGPWRPFGKRGKRYCVKRIELVGGDVRHGSAKDGG